ncbi:carbohydrate kinase pfkb [Lucifera butyrica]|uniref:Tagatose-6-phosphate kinase n=1 Tax=Lucifera butyrica TaxID=1351585 RepID=A0A498RA03_9FIRM|nr:1-phosphofructokinase [Lucifera butyrica]VBB07815.1 carbohydrate kinase pfkb [Lucifera butyrica]
MKKKLQTTIAAVTLNPALDQTVYCDTFQLGQVNRVSRDRFDAGGKGINVAKVITALGCTATVTGFLGRDNSQFFKRFFQNKQIHDRFVEVEGATRVNIKIVDESNGLVSEINFPGLNCSQADCERLQEVVRQLAADHELFILAGSLPQGASGAIYQEFIKVLNQYGCKVFLDASGNALAEGIKAGPYAIKPNLPELSQLVGRQLRNDAELLKAVNELLAGGIQQVVVSLGERGALAASRDEQWIVRPPKVKVGSTVGAGDAMVAGLAVGEVRGLPLAERVRLGTAAAAASVAQPGTQAASQADVTTLLDYVQIVKQEDNHENRGLIE